MNMRWFTTSIIGLALLVQNFALAGYPERPLRLIIPAPAGGATDVVGRLVALRLVDRLGQQVVVDNRGGAGGIIGAEIAAKAAADGYTLLMPTSNHAAGASLMKLPYDPVEDFTMVSLIVDQPGLIVAHPSVPFNTFSEFIAYTRQHADLNYANPGAATFPGLVMAMLISRAGLKMTSVTYKGAGPAMVDLLSGRVQLKVDSYVTAFPHAKTGRLKLLAVTTASRVDLLPDTPTIVEMGFPGTETAFFMGIVGPKRLPEPVRTRLERALIDSVKAADVSKRLSVDGFRPLAASGAELDRLIRREIKLWEKVVRDAKIRVN
jgi:tripartite-type tricarboxylate transporter receptor subunit TctC